MVWTFHTIPHPGEEGYDTWPKDAWKYAGGTNTWGEITVDEKRGIAYFPTGSPTYDYYGADRIGSNLFGNCLLALDARTGKKLWHFQMVHHDLWDYDNNAAPQLITVRHSGKVIDAVRRRRNRDSCSCSIASPESRCGRSKNVRCRRATCPASRRGRRSHFQPRRLRTPAEDDRGRREPVHPDRRRARRVEGRMSKMRNEGLFTPPGFEETVSLPGARGGSNWGTSAANPAKGLVYLTTQDWPTIYKLSLDDPLAARRTADQPQTGERDLRKAMPVVSWANGEGSAGDRPRLPAAVVSSSKPSARSLTGRGEMPAFADLDAAAIAAIHAFLNPSGQPPRKAARSLRRAGRGIGRGARRPGDSRFEIGRRRSADLRIRVASRRRRIATTPTGASIPISRISSGPRGQPSSRTT